MEYIYREASGGTRGMMYHDRNTVIALFKGTDPSTPFVTRRIIAACQDLGDLALCWRLAKASDM